MAQKREDICMSIYLCIYIDIYVYIYICLSLSHLIREREREREINAQGDFLKNDPESKWRSSSINKRLPECFKHRIVIACPLLPFQQCVKSNFYISFFDLLDNLCSALWMLLFQSFGNFPGQGK